MKRLGYPYNRPVQSRASDAITPVVRADDDHPVAPLFDDPLLAWHYALDRRGLAVTRLIWNDAGRGPKLVQFKHRKRPCSLNGLFELGVRGNTAVGFNAQTAQVGPVNTAVGRSALTGASPAALSAAYGMGADHPALNAEDRLGTIRAVIEGVRVPDVRWHTRDDRGTEGAVMVDDQEWSVVQFKGGGSRAEAHVGTEPDEVLARLFAAVEAFEAGTANTQVSARARGTSRIFRRKF